MADTPYGDILYAGSFQTAALILADGSITDTSGAISFGNENLSTTGNFQAQGVTTADAAVACQILNQGVKATIFQIKNSAGNVAFTCLNGTLQSQFFTGSAANPGISLSGGTGSNTGFLRAGATAGEDGVDGISITNDGTVRHTFTKSGHHRLTLDNQEIQLGTAQDAAIYYDGTDLIIDPKVVGTGAVNLNGATTIAGDLNHDGTNVGFYGTAPVAQGAAVADATDAATAISQLNALLARIRATGLIAT